MADDSNGKDKHENCFCDGYFLRANIPQLLEHVFVLLLLGWRIFCRVDSPFQLNLDGQVKACGIRQRLSVHFLS